MNAETSIRSWAVIASCALTLGACVAPRERIDRFGAFPAPSGGTFSLIGYREAEPPGLTAAVADEVRHAGLAQVERKANYSVEFVYSERGRHVGAYSPAPADGDPVWLERPMPGPWWPSRRRSVRQLTIRITETKSGHEVYRATAAEAVTPDQPLDWAKLAKDALSGSAPSS